MSATVRDLVGRWYDALWNPWNTQVLPEITHPDVRLRGSLGTSWSGHDGVSAYMGAVQGAFPDFRNEVLSLLVEGELALAHLRYTGTHEGHFQGIEPTGRRICYEGLARFQAQAGKLRQVWVLGDTASLFQQLRGESAPPARPAQPDQRVVPCLRASDWDRSRAFWVGGLGFQVTFEWRHGPGFPVYAGITRDGAALHLSGYPGDCLPGGAVSILVADVNALHAELTARGVEAAAPLDQAWGRRELSLRDPDGNRVTFHTPLPPPTG